MCKYEICAKVHSIVVWTWPTARSNFVTVRPTLHAFSDDRSKILDYLYIGMLIKP